MTVTWPVSDSAIRMASVTPSANQPSPAPSPMSFRGRTASDATAGFTASASPVGRLERTKPVIAATTRNAAAAQSQFRFTRLRAGAAAGVSCSRPTSAAPFRRDRTTLVASHQASTSAREA